MSNDEEPILDLVRQIDRVCDEYEARLREGDPPRFAPYLERIESKGRAALLKELAALALEDLAGRVSDPAACLVEANPDLMEELSLFLRDSADTIIQAIPACSLDTSQDPQRIGRYAIRNRIGGGAFGTVYLGYDDDLQRSVAIKLPRKDQVETESQIERFLEEARNAARLRQQPGVVPVYDYGCHADGSPFVVMDYVEGSTLEGLLADGQLPPDRAADLVGQIARAIHAAHKAGIVHRDLKPGNILIDNQGRAQVTDFGLSLHESVQHQRRGEFAGTLPYMSPEQVLRKSQQLDGRTDIWSLGVILYEMLVGKPPFRGDTSQALAEEILEHNPKPPRQIDERIPHVLERVCLKCLEKRVADRYSSAADIAEELAAPTALESISAAQAAVGSPEKNQSTSRRPMFTCSIAVAISLAFVSLGVGVLFRPGGRLAGAILKSPVPLSKDIAEADAAEEPNTIPKRAGSQFDADPEETLLVVSPPVTPNPPIESDDSADEGSAPESDPSWGDPPSEPSFREWVDNTGKHFIHASMQRQTDDGVVLRKKNGTEITVPLNRLSESDRLYAMAQHKDGHSPPAGHSPRAALKYGQRDSAWANALIDDPEEAGQWSAVRRMDLIDTRMRYIVPTIEGDTVSVSVGYATAGRMKEVASGLTPESGGKEVTIQESDVRVTEPRSLNGKWAVGLKIEVDRRGSSVNATISPMMRLPTGKTIAWTRKQMNSQYRRRTGLVQDGWWAYENLDKLQSANRQQESKFQSSKAMHDLQDLNKLEHKIRNAQKALSKFDPAQIDHAALEQIQEYSGSVMAGSGLAIRVMVNDRLVRFDDRGYVTLDES